MTAQPQPTTALRDAELIRDVQATLDDMETHELALTAGNLIDALDYHGIRLAAAAQPAGQVVDENAIRQIIYREFTGERELFADDDASVARRRWEAMALRVAARATRKIIAALADVGTEAE